MNSSDDAVTRQYAYQKRHPDTVFHPATGRDPMSRASIEHGTVEVGAIDLRRLMNHLELSDPEHLMFQWRAVGRNVYAHTGDRAGGFDGPLIAVMDTSALAAGVCAIQNGRLAARGGLTPPVRPASAASRAGV